MRADLEQKPGENDLDWLTRLHGMVLDKVAVRDADPEVIAILLNNIPSLISQVRGGRMDADLAERKEFGGPRIEGM